MAEDLSYRQGKYVHDARALLERNGAAAYERRIADDLLDLAGALDGLLTPAAGGDVLLRYGRDRHARLKKGGPAHQRCSEGYAAGFAAYLAGHSDPEKLGLHTGDASKGGYAAPMGFVGALNQFLDARVHVRALGATILPPSVAPSVRASGFATDYDDADWTAEVPASDLTEDDDARAGVVELTPHLLTKYVKASRSIVKSAEPDLQAVLVRRLGTRVAITEEKAFLTGSGVGRPLGVFTTSADGVSTSQDVTASSATDFTADNLISLLYALPEVHLERSAWLAGKEFYKRARTLKDGGGQYLWRAGLGNVPGTLLDRPYAMSAHAPSTYTSGQPVAVVADWGGYFIQDGLGVDVQRLDELLVLKNTVAFICRKEVDGHPAIPNAFRRLKLA